MSDRPTKLSAEIGLDIGNPSSEANQETMIALLGGAIKEVFGELISLASATEGTICSLTVPAGKTWRFKYVYAEGCSNGIFRLYVDSAKVWQSRNAWTKRNVQADVEFEATEGEVVSLKVFNKSLNSADFSGRIQMYEL